MVEQDVDSDDRTRDAERAPLLAVKDVVVEYGLNDGDHIRAVNHVDLEISDGEVLGLVGESGCGKSTLGRAILRLVEVAGGRVEFEGRDLTTMDARELRALRRDLQVVFQDPRGSLDPRMRVGEVLTEPLRVHGLADRGARRRIALEMLERVGLDPAHVDRRPTELSGGQQQRVGIARALVTRPKLVVLDEPVSALDVSVQAQVVNLLQDMQAEYDAAFLFIAHDLAVVRHISQRVAVMYLGEIVEEGEAGELFANPRHPYTVGLVASVLRPDTDGRERLETAVDYIAGDIPSLREPPSGCRYHTRCPFARDRCRHEAPPLEHASTGTTQHRVACHYWEEIADEAPDLQAR